MPCSAMPLQYVVSRVLGTREPQPTWIGNEMQEFNEALDDIYRVHPARREALRDDNGR